MLSPTEPPEAELGLAFRDRRLLQTALVHTSYPNERPDAGLESNERLEFLGDAVVGLVVADELYRRRAELPEGDLTLRRSAVVREEGLARAAERLGAGAWLLLGKGEEASGGRGRPSNLAAAYEALVGAVFLDQGYGAAREFVLRSLEPELAHAAAYEAASKGPKAAFQEMVQTRGSAAPTYRVVEVSGPPHDRRFTVEALVEGKVAGRGSGPRKALAEQDAARDALRRLRAEG